MPYSFNPFSGTFDYYVADTDTDSALITHEISADLTIAAGTTLMHTQTEIADGVTVEIADGGNLFLIE